MLGKLNRNKFLIILLPLLLGIISCKSGETIFVFPDTELSCPDGLTVLIKYAKLADVRAGILQHIADKKKYGTTENYTVIRLPDKRSIKIDRKPPEEILGCSLRESNYVPIKAKYLYGDEY